MTLTDAAARPAALPTPSQSSTASRASALIKAAVRMPAVSLSLADELAARCASARAAIINAVVHGRTCKRTPWPRSSQCGSLFRSRRIIAIPRYGLGSDRLGCPAEPEVIIRDGGRVWFPALRGGCQRRIVSTDRITSMKITPSRVSAILISVIGLWSGSTDGMAYAPTLPAENCARAVEMNDGWTISTPESVGFQPHQLCAIADAERNGRLRNLHGVVVVRRGRLVFEQYFTGSDWSRGSSLGEVTFRAETLHDIRSITKSIVSLLYGIAQAAGKVPPIDRPVLDFFPELADLRTDPARMRILVRHALTMTMGTEWREGVQFAWDDPNNDEAQMEMAADRYRYIMGRPIVAAPGERWNYNGGATAIIARLVSRGTEQPLLDFAREQLFGPLAITEVEWITDRTGEPIAAWGLRLRPRDLAKIGQLVLQRGRWGERQVVPSGWIEAATAAEVQTTDPFLRYGYQWWLAGSNFGDAQTPWVAGFGRGGQRVFILPDLELVVVVTAGNYRDPESWRLPNAVLNQFVLPALVGAPRE